jgi:hypothetical protein
MAREAGIDEWWDNGGDWRETFNEHLKAFEALVRADECALAAPVQEPEYVYTCNGCDTLYREDDVACDCTVNGLMEFTRHILVSDTTPPKQPPQRTWVGLTKDELMSIFDTAVVQFEDWAYERAIEAKLKQKNGFAEDKNT